LFAGRLYASGSVNLGHISALSLVKEVYSVFNGVYQNTPDYFQMIDRCCVSYSESLGQKTKILINAISVQGIVSVVRFGSLQVLQDRRER